MTRPPVTCSPWPRHGVLLLLLLLAAAGCGGSSGSTDATAPPATAGQVWEVEDGEDRASTPGAIVAFVNGVHVMVIDGDRVFAGTTPLKTSAGEGGSRTVTFPSGLTADLVPGSGGAELRFSTGERAHV